MADIDVGLSANSMIAPMEKTVEKGGEFNFDYVEFLMDDELNHRALSERIDEVTALAEANDVELLVHLPFHTSEDSAIGTTDDTIRDSAIKGIKNSVDVSRRLNATKGVLHIETDDAPHLVDVGKTDQLISILTSLDKYASKRDFELCVENLPERYPNLANLEYLLDQTDVYLTVDTGHAVINGYESEEIAEFVSRYTDRISHIHLNDNRDRIDEHLPFRAGTIDFELILEPLTKGWNGTMTFEIQTTDFDYIDLSKRKLDRLLPS